MMTVPHSTLVFVFPERDDLNKTSAYLLSDKEYTTNELSVFIDALGEIMHSFSHENHQFLLDVRNRNNFYKLLKNYNDKEDYPKVADAFLATIANVHEMDSPSKMAENASFTINEAPISIDVFAEVACRKLSLPNISSSCTISTQITDLFDRLTPKTTLIVAPVIYQHSIQNLMSDFPKRISDTFKIIYLREDNQLEGNIVIPGIGGDIEQRLGIQHNVNEVERIPFIVKKRIAYFRKTTE